MTTTTATGERKRPDANALFAPPRIGVGLCCLLADWSGRAWDRAGKCWRQVPARVDGAPVVTACETGVWIEWDGGEYYVPEWNIVPAGGHA